MIFKNGEWNEKINVRDFIVRNYTPYEATQDFLRLRAIKPLSCGMKFPI
mgnify:CR=1 FL=1